MSKALNLSRTERGPSLDSQLLLRRPSSLDKRHHRITLAANTKHFGSYSSSTRQFLRNCSCCLQQTSSTATTPFLAPTLAHPVPLKQHSTQHKAQSTQRTAHNTRSPGFDRSPRICIPGTRRSSPCQSTASPSQQPLPRSPIP